MASQAMMVPRAHLDHLALLHHGSCSLHQLDAVCAHQVPADPQAQLDLADHLAPRACPDKPAGQATMDDQDHSAMLDPQAKVAGQAALDPRETTDAMWKHSLLDHPDPLENLEQTAQLDHPVKLAGQAMLVHPDPADHLVHLAKMVMLVPRVTLVPRASQDHQARTPPTAHAQGALKPPRPNQHHDPEQKKETTIKTDFKGFIVAACGLFLFCSTKW